MTDHSAAGSSQTSLLRRTWPLLAVALLVGGYFAVMAVIRAHVDGQIEKSVGTPLPEFALEDRDGKRWDPEGLRGRRVLLHFFRSRCPACLANAPEIRRLEASLGAGEQLVGVMTDGALGFAPEETRATLAAHDYHHPVLMADEAFMEAFHGVAWSQVTPVFYVVDATGAIVRSFRGAQPFEVLRGALDGLDR